MKKLTGKCLEAKELRIQSLVEYNGMIMKVSEICSPKPRKEKRYSDKYVIELFDGAGLLNCTLDEIKPIQLTEEWLISCQSNSIFNNGFDYKKTSTGRFEVYISVYLVTVLEFVHELQNLNFALLGEDVVFSDNIL